MGKTCCSSDSDDFDLMSFFMIVVLVLVMMLICVPQPRSRRFVVYRLSSPSIKSGGNVNWPQFNKSRASGDWNDLLRTIPEGARVLDALSSYHMNNHEDTRVWSVENNDKFDSGASWDCVRDHGNIVPWSHLMWSTKVIPKHQFILWLSFRERLNTRDRIKKYMSISDPNCLLYLGHEETIEHLIWNCPFASLLWRRFFASMSLLNFPNE
ncbi:uncharacterized protein LOC124912872 [Impatiens glandulifera]|uniref:uncharacterized protein LOC124912872 n=1 Tax=Impatiens glandulifera TaxID=253017 RepID=UPI001FB0CC65|nr:uncharacterized protein LOC124912872 [Impatiens glandulifera]